MAVGKTKSSECCTSFVYAVRTDMDGNLLWERKYVHPLYSPMGWEGYTQYGKDIAIKQSESPQTDFVILATTTYPESLGCRIVSWILTISDTLEGDTLWTRTFDTYPTYYPKAIFRCYDGGFVMSGHIERDTRITDIWLCRVDSLGNDVPYSIEEPHVSATPLPKQLEVAVHPNPFNSSVEIHVSVPDAEDFSVQIYDISGKHVRDLSSESGNSFIWNGKDKKGLECPSGTYIYKVTCGDHIVTDNILFVK